MSLTSITKRFKSNVRWKRSDFAEKLDGSRDRINHRCSEVEQLCNISLQLSDSQWKQVFTADDHICQAIDAGDMPLFDQYLRGYERMVTRWFEHRVEVHRRQVSDHRPPTTDRQTASPSA